MSDTKAVWLEVWADDTTDPPYVLLVRPSPKEPDQILVQDPKSNYSVVFRAGNYEAVKMWLLEDEYVRVEGRVTSD
jgi:hypothetical protein